MVLSAPWSDSLVIIFLQPVKKWLGINPMGPSAPCADYLGVIPLDPVNKKGLGLTKCSLMPLGTTLMMFLPFSQ